MSDNNLLSNKGIFGKKTEDNKEAKLIISAPEALVLVQKLSDSLGKMCALKPAFAPEQKLVENILAVGFAKAAAYTPPQEQQTPENTHRTTATVS